ncbi:hypothetical protein B0T25DRAFT_218638 [Lasiosphaeria hispida]|uniref:RING-type domain-containing protein n=1 Tax=Lasiosphaeria hispida TaxID=260671 RepID=A0AAJ0HJ71_9PEZI|nr:hypothetical protein B0T25DRAFT_218638 [Lasiosphaeria hispida]
MGLSELIVGTSGLSKTKSLTAPSSSAMPSPSDPDSALSVYISDEAHLKPLDDAPPDLRELNACLEALTVVFPNIQVMVFREMLAAFEGESRLAVVADVLLKNGVSYVKGRWRLPAEQKGEAGVRSRSNCAIPVPSSERFRSDEYKAAAKALAWHEFRGLSRSTINAVLAESNYSYLEARQSLVQLSSKSWRFTISALFMRRKPVTSNEAETHPLVIWKSTGRGSILPCIKSTGSSELDRELYHELIIPLKRRARTEQELKDRRIAVDLNNKEAEEADGTFECACCFTEAAFEEFTSCNAEGHMICFRCVQHSITEAVFGQGWQRSIDKETGTLRCPAVASQECKGCIPQDHTHRAMLEEKNGAEIMHKLDQRLADHSIISSGLPLVRCPFCEYAEVDDIYLPVSEDELRLRAHNIYNLILIVLCICTIPFFLPIITAVCFVGLLASSKHVIGDRITKEFRDALTRHRRRRRGLKFKCENDECLRDSCLSCGKEWVDVHVCNESSLVALRTQIEQNMSMAIKRVCPRCNTSFVKNAGCNKLTCPCGYKMCYVCRRDIGGTGDGPDVGYRHFCEHFRPEGDPRPCTQCRKCNLWETEDTEKVLQQAKEEAERKWLETEKRDLSGAEKAFLETGLAVQSGQKSIELALRGGRLPTFAEVCDFFVELVLV